MKIGYARVSTSDQNLDSQLDALKRMNCVEIFTDKISGRIEERNGLNLALSFARENDSLVVYSLSRLSRSLKHLIEVANELERRKVGLISLTEQIDTSSPTGKLLFHLLASLAQFDVDLVKQRTLIGLEAARARGKIGGRPIKLTADKLKLLEELKKSKNLSATELAKLLGVSRSTIYRSNY